MPTDPPRPPATHGPTLLSNESVVSALALTKSSHEQRPKRNRRSASDPPQSSPDAPINSAGPAPSHTPSALASSAPTSSRSSPASPAPPAGMIAATSVCVQPASSNQNSDL